MQHQLVNRGLPTALGCDVALYSAMLFPGKSAACSSLKVALSIRHGFHISRDNENKTFVLLQDASINVEL